MKTFTSLLLAVAVSTTLLARPVQAQDGKPFAVISVRSASAVGEQAAALAQIAGMPQATQMLLGPLAQLTTPPEGSGLDAEKPWGALLTLEDKSALIFIPATNVDFLAAAFLAGDAEEIPGGITKYALGTGPVIFVKQQGDWTFVGNKPSALESLPDDPAKHLGDLPKQYLIGARIDVENVPDMMKQQAIGALAMMSGNMPSPGGPGALPPQMQQLQMMLEQAKSLDFGLKLDKGDNSLILEANVVAKSGTALANTYGRVKKTTSNFAGFMSPAAALSSLTVIQGKPNDSEIEMMQAQQADLKNQLATAFEGEELPEEAKEAIIDALGDLIDVGYDTMKSGNIDFGMLVSLDPSPTVLMGGAVNGGKKAEAAAQRLGKMLEGGEGMPVIQWDAGEINGYRTHRTAIDLPIDAESKEFVLKSDKVEIILAATDDSLLIAIGGACEETIKKVLADSEAGKSTERLPMEMSISIANIIQFAAKAGEAMGQPLPLPPPVLAGIAQNADKTHLRITADGIPDGVKYQVIVEEGILKLAPLPMQMMMGAMGGGPGGPGGESPAGPAGPPEGFPGGDGSFDEEDFGDEDEDIEDSDF